MNDSIEKDSWEEKGIKIVLLHNLHFADSLYVYISDIKIQI